MKRRVSRRVALLAQLLGTAGCSQFLGIEGLNGPGDGGPIDGPPLAECQAQRVVHLVGGNGGLAWFTLVWPAPAVITGFQPTYAYDDPAKAKDVSFQVSHRMFARRLAMRALWETVGGNPQPTVFVAGQNETHTSSPQSIAINAGVGLDAAASVIQAPLQPKYRTLIFSNAGPFGVATGAPSPVGVLNIDGAVGIFHGAVSPDIEGQLRPTTAQLARYVPNGEAQVEITLATELAYTANAFRYGLLGTVIMPAFNDDPHGAFAAGVVTQRADDLAVALDAFYTDLAAVNEPTCGHNGQPLSLADNTVLIVTGDTPKDSFNNSGWADGTPGNANWMYMRSNGFTQLGWFGQVQVGSRTNFDPTTGALDAMATVPGSTAAAFAGTLYAVARGNRMAVSPFTVAPYDGVLLSPPR